MNNMKVGYLFLFLLSGLGSFAQPGRSDIRKHHILKAVEQRMNADSSVTEQTWWYDRQGYDSVEIVYGETHHFNNTYKNGRIQATEVVKPEGKSDQYSYEYLPDGSYKQTYKDGRYGLTSYEWVDKKGNTTKSQSPDGNTTFYTYDAKGHQLSAKSDGKNQGTRINNKYFYNAKGQLIKAQNKADESHSETTYQYDAKGKLVKTMQKGVWGGEESESVGNYTYYDNGMVKSITYITKDASSTGEGTVIRYEYDYEYY